jgi:predicted lactoylglutathione lyase
MRTNDGRPLPFTNVTGPRDDRFMEIQLSMVVLEVRNLEQSVAFYRRLGLDIPEPRSERPIVIHRMGSGVSLLLTTDFASVYDPEFARPTSGYQQLLEFYVGEDAVVDSTWSDLIDAGYHGRMPPRKTAGPYAAMVDDPDGNVILLTSDEATRP